MTRRLLPGRSAGLLPWTGAIALALATTMAGCGAAAWLPADLCHGTALAAYSEAAPLGEVSFAPPDVRSLVALAGAPDDSAAVEGNVPGLEVLFGISLIDVGSSVAGHSGPPPASPDNDPVLWNEAYESGFGFDVALVLKRPPRGALSLAAGDTFVIARGSFDTYSTPEVAPAVGGFDEMTIISGWLDGRTLLNPVDARGTVRFYLNYGGGIALYPQVTRGGVANWQGGTALGWHTGVGVEYRAGSLSLYAQGGVQVIGPPDVDEGYTDPLDIDAHEAQNLVTYPIKLGATIGF